MYRILMLNGPNLNLLGERESEVYGHLSLDDIIDRVRLHALDRGAELDAYQSNSEGSIIDRIHAARRDCDGLIINPGAYSSSHAIGDALRSVLIPAVEVHLSNVYAREAWRQVSNIAPAAAGQICGFGWHVYILAVDAILHRLAETHCT